MSITNINMTAQDKNFCRVWLAKYTTMIMCLGDEFEFTEHKIKALINHEIENKARVPLIVRLVGRYNTIRRKREWKDIEIKIANTRRIESERVKDRKLSSGGS